MKVFENDYYKVCFHDVDGLGCYNEAKFMYKKDADLYALSMLGGDGKTGRVTTVNERIEVFECLEEAGVNVDAVINRIKEKLKLARLTPEEMAFLGIK